MGRFDLGVFVDAHHLFGVEPREQSASVVLARIEAAAEEQCMSFGVANRLVVADCSDVRARDIAEDFGRLGFVIRHIPQDAPLTRDHALTAEIVEAVVSREELRTVAVVADPGVPLSVADTLHRAGRAVIAGMAGHAQGVPAVDRAITFALDREGLRPLLAQAVGSLHEKDREEVQMPEFVGILRGLQPDFDPNDYGAPMKKLLQQMSGPEYRFVEPDRILVPSRGAASSARQKSQDASDAPSGFGLGSTTSLIQVMRQAAQVLPSIAPTDEAAVVQALRSVLELAADRQQLRDAAITEGLVIQVVVAGLKVVAGEYKALGQKTTDLCHQAVVGTTWTVQRDEANPARIRLRLSNGAPAPT